MRSSRVLPALVVLLVAAVFFINTDVDCKPTIEKIEQEAAGRHAAGSGGGSESWARWAVVKLAGGLGFTFKADDDDPNISHAGQVTKDEDAAKDKACKLGEEAKKKAAEVKDKVEEKVCDMAEESKKRAAEAGDMLYRAEEKAEEGYEAAESKAGEIYESGKEKLGHQQEL